MNLAHHWTQAMDIDTYVAQLWRKHRTRFARNRDRTSISAEDRVPFEQQPLRVLVLTEPYCEDSAQFVPLIWRLAQDVDDVELRILRQSQHPELASRYLTERGHPAIPVFILLDEQLQELGALVERPARVTAELTAATRRFQAAHPNLPGIRRALERMPEETRAALKLYLTEWRDSQHDRWSHYLFEDLAAITHGRSASHHQAHDAPRR